MLDEMGLTFMEVEEIDIERYAENCVYSAIITETDNEINDRQTGQSSQKDQ